jgi:uncharacterized protein (TIGR00369 family)
MNRTRASRSPAIFPDYRAGAEPVGHAANCYDALRAAAKEWFVERIRESFDRQGFMRTLGAVLESVEPGTVTISCGFTEALTQQHGLLHGGVVASIIDVACGYAALSKMPPDREVLTVEFKVHFLKPAKTERVIAVGQVVQSGRTPTVCEGSVFDHTRRRLLARMTATMMAVDATAGADATG